MGLFDFFNKKKIEQKKQDEKKLELFRKTKLVEDKLVTVNVGKTSVILIFDDGEQLTKVITGQANQYTNSGSDGSENYSKRPEEPRVYDISLRPSESIASGFIAGIQPHECNYTNNDWLTTEVRLGKVKHAKILKTIKYEIEVQTYKIVPKEQGE